MEPKPLRVCYGDAFFNGWALLFFYGGRCFSFNDNDSCSYCL